MRYILLHTPCAHPPHTGLTKIEQVMVEGLPPVYQRALSTMGAQLVEDSLNDYPVHQFKPEDLRTADRMGYEVKNIQITATGLAVHLVPRR